MKTDAEISVKVAEKCKIIKMQDPRKVWGLGINKKLAGGQDLPNCPID